jgi:hypothetical protein
MLGPNEKSTGTTYTCTIGLLAVAFLFIPAVVAMSLPATYLEFFTALSLMAGCLALARWMWKRHSDLTIPSLEDRPGVTR